MSERDMLQKRVDHWMDCLRETEEDMSDLRRDCPEWEGAERVRRDYRGRIHAAQCFSKILGLDLETDYVRIA